MSQAAFYSTHPYRTVVSHQHLVPDELCIAQDVAAIRNDSLMNIAEMLLSLCCSSTTDALLQWEQTTQMLWLLQIFEDADSISLQHQFDLTVTVLH